MDGFWGAIGYDWVLGMVIIGSLCHHCSLDYLLWRLLFIIVDILFYFVVYIILIC